MLSPREMNLLLQNKLILCYSYNNLSGLIMCAHGEMDITKVFGTLIAGSSPAERAREII